MSYRWVEHTAELELHIEAANQCAVFADALLALAELIGDAPRDAGDAPTDTTVAPPDTTVAREVALSARDLPGLLAAWLDELVFLIETEDLVPDGVERLELDGTTLAATVRGHRGRPRHLVKGVTYHELAFERVIEGFRATVVLDV